MNIKKYVITLIVCAFSVATMSMFANAQPPVSKCPALNGQIPMESGVNSQVYGGENGYIANIYTNYYNTIGPLRVELINKRTQLNALLNSPAVDKAQIEKLSKEIGDIEGKLLSARIDLQTQLSAQGVAPETLGLNSADIPAQGPNPNSPYNWGGPHHYKQHRHGMRNHYRQGYGPGYPGIPNSPYPNMGQNSSSF